MTSPDREYRPVVDPTSGMERSPDQALRESALHEVEQTLLNIEETIKRADRARKAIPNDPAVRNLRLSLDVAVASGEAPGKSFSRRRTSATKTKGCSQSYWERRTDPGGAYKVRQTLAQDTRGSERGEAQTFFQRTDCLLWR